jgi:hypothetical protein
VPKLVERVRYLRAVGINYARAGALPTPVFERMADEAARIATQHLVGLNPLRWRAILAAGAIALEEELTDATLAMFEKLMVSLGRAAERKTDEQAARSMREVQADLRVFAASGRAMIEARRLDGNLEGAVAAKVRWPRFEAAVARAEALCARRRPAAPVAGRPEQGRGQERARPRDLPLPARRAARPLGREPSLPGLRSQPHRRRRDPVEHGYLHQAAADLGVGPDMMRHVAPLGWVHLSLTGDYAWNADDQPGLGQLRPLRTKPSLLVA